MDVLRLRTAARSIQCLGTAQIIFNLETNLLQTASNAIKSILLLQICLSDIFSTKLRPFRCDSNPPENAASLHDPVKNDCDPDRSVTSTLRQKISEASDSLAHFPDNNFKKRKRKQRTSFSSLTSDIALLHGETSNHTDDEILTYKDSTSTGDHCKEPRQYDDVRVPGAQSLSDTTLNRLNTFKYNQSGEATRETEQKADSQPSPDTKTSGEARLKDTNETKATLRYPKEDHEEPDHFEKAPSFAVSETSVLQLDEEGHVRDSSDEFPIDDTIMFEAACACDDADSFASSSQSAYDCSDEPKNLSNGALFDWAIDDVSLRNDTHEVCENKLEDNGEVSNGDDEYPIEQDVLEEAAFCAEKLSQISPEFSRSITPSRENAPTDQEDCDIFSEFDDDPVLHEEKHFNGIETEHGVGDYDDREGSKSSCNLASVTVASKRDPWSLLQYIPPPSNQQASPQTVSTIPLSPLALGPTPTICSSGSTSPDQRLSLKSPQKDPQTCLPTGERTILDSNKNIADEPSSSQLMPAPPFTFPAPHRHTNKVPFTSKPISHSSTSRPINKTTPLSPFIRPSFPPPLPTHFQEPTPPILPPTFTPTPRLLTTFRLAEILRSISTSSSSSSSSSPSPNLLFESYILITFSHRHGPTQHFTLADIFFPHHGPYIHAIYNGWQGSKLFEDDTAPFLNAAGASSGVMARAIVTPLVKAKCTTPNQRGINQVGKKGEGEREGQGGSKKPQLRILSIWPAGWEDVAYVRGIVDPESS
ncbi:MAG: hypothetical protein Q9227_002032 [Pyrenula ochraceoflavens]